MSCTSSLRIGALFLCVSRFLTRSKLLWLAFLPCLSAWPQASELDILDVLLEDRPLSESEVFLYDINQDGVVDSADLRSEKLCTVTIRGRVMDSLGETLISNATISLVENGNVVESGQDYLGFYRLENVLEGAYEIRVTDRSGLFEPFAAEVVLDCTDEEVVLDIRLVEKESPVLAAIEWFNDFLAAKGATSADPPEEIQEEVLVYYFALRDSSQTSPIAELESLEQDVFPGLDSLAARLSELRPASFSPVIYSETTYENLHVLREGISPSLFVESISGFQPQYFYIGSLYIDMVDNLLPSPSWWETYLLAMEEVADGAVPAVRERAFGSLLSQIYGPRGRLGPTGRAILEKLYKGIPHTFDHWGTYFPREIVFELLGVELGQEARELLALIWNEYRSNHPADAPSIGPGSLENLDEIALASALSQIDGNNALINEDYLAWFSGIITEQPEAPEIRQFIEDLEPISSNAAPWEDYSRYFEIIDTFVTSPLPIPPATPETDGLAIQCIFDAYRWIRTATPSDQAGGINQQELINRIQPFAKLYIRSFGAEVNSRDLFDIAPGKSPLPGIDTTYSNQDDLLASEPEKWDEWLASYEQSRSANLAEMWQIDPSPEIAVLLTGAHTLSASTKESTTLELNPFQQRLAHFVMAQYLFEYAQEEHRNILFDPKPDPIGPGLPPEPSNRMKELATWYVASLTLMSKADSGDGWTAGGLAVPDTRLYAILRFETKRGLMEIAEAIGLTVQGFDPWGILKRPFSTAEPQRLAEILEQTIEAWNQWRAQDEDTELLNLENNRSQHLNQAADFDVLSTQFARDAAFSKLRQAEVSVDVQQARRTFALQNIDRAELRRQAAELYQLAASGELSVQELRANLASNKYDLLVGQAEVLSEFIAEIQNGLTEAITVARPLLEDPKQLITDFIEEYQDIFERKKSERGFWDKAVGVGENFLRKVSEPLFGFDILEGIEQGYNVFAALISDGDVSKSFENLGELLRTYINSPRFKDGLKTILKEKFKIELSENDLKNLIQAGDDFIVDVFPQDLAKLREELLKKFLMEDFGDVGITLANEVIVELLTDSTLGKGITFSLVDSEVSNFAAEVGLTPDAEIIGSIVSFLREKATTDLTRRLGGTTSTIDGTIFEAIFMLPSDSPIMSDTETVEAQIFADIVENNADANEAFGAIILARVELSHILKNRLSDLEGWDSTKAASLLENWDDFVKRRASELTAEDFSFDLSPQELFALLPDEAKGGIKDAKKLLKQSVKQSSYITNQESHEKKMNKNGDLFANGGDDRRKAEANRNKHIAEFIKNVTGMAESLNQAIAKTSAIQQELVKIKTGGLEAEVKAAIEEKLIGVEMHLAEAKQRELMVASQEVSLAHTELEVADHQIRLAELSIGEQESILEGLEQQLLADQARASAAETANVIALTKAEFHSNANALDMDRAWYWRHLTRETAYRIVFRGLFDYARTIDLLRGTDLMGVLDQINVNSIEQAQLALEIFEILLFDDEVAGAYNIILSNEDDTPGFRVGDKVSLGAPPPEELGVAVGTFEDALLLPDREGDDYWVWQIELLNGDGDNSDHYHPGIRDSPSIHNLLPKAITSSSPTISVRATGVGERKVFRSVPIRTFVGENPTTLNTAIHLIHLGDMWMNSQSGASSDIAIQNTGVAPVELLGDGTYQLEGRADDFSDLSRINNPLYVFLANSADPLRRELATSRDFGANYPVLGTWWVMVRKDLFPADMHMEIEFFVTSVQQLDTENAFMTAIEMEDANQFKTELVGAKSE